ncbi:beta-glucosidase 12-like [Pistacia vera]|uniref:beta-glucosidase 12-like n=1 Tax=Pistacia vera TaxID=55513 RepID=UPI0012636747|nr:beta-glucosidase 12-like [Pistacia vera]
MKVRQLQEAGDQVSGIISLTHTQEDVKIMKDMNTDAFRFSISWSRVLPGGKLKRGVNMEGIRFYNNLINELLANGLQPFVTFFHWDVPQALEDDYGGFLSASIVDDFRDFAELCFKEFGDRVKHWITLNEPNMFSYRGYDLGNWAPARCSKWVYPACEAGNSATEPYIVGHNLLLAHAAAVQLYKQKYQATQKGQIGITLTTVMMLPYSNSTSDVAAAKRALDFNLGWFLDPVVYGDYPASMSERVGIRLPVFSKRQSKRLKGSYDFIGINYYTTYYARSVPAATVNISYSTDSGVETTPVRNGVPIGEQPGSSWLYVYPKGIRDLLLHTKRNYKNPVIYITENGVCDTNNTATLPHALEDPVRVLYYYRHLLFLHRAIKDGVNVKGFFAWTLLDDFEWTSGFTSRFGINFVDFSNGSLKRYPKQSATWFKNFLQK